MMQTIIRDVSEQQHSQSTVAIAPEIIPVASPDLAGNEERYVIEAIRSSWISSSGEYVKRFEREFAELCSAHTALSVCNGTVALHLALLALDVRPGDEVLVPSLTYIATANAVRYVGAEPVFVDVDPETWCIDPKLLEASITRRTKGIIVVHLYGHPADMDAINNVAAVHGLWVIEDAAEAHFARYKGRTVGSLATMATFSFFGNKIITSGEGGAVTLRDPTSKSAREPCAGKGSIPTGVTTFRLLAITFVSPILPAPLLCAQLERREALMERRQHIFTLYNELLRDIPGDWLSANRAVG
ncbi:MAG: DegT/DnrJ/EryC1/StrS family aminotransferase [Chloroflexia bacterium]